MATTKNNQSTDRISNVIISNLITYDQEYPWHLLNLEPNLTFVTDDITFKVYYFEVY